ncbi:MAG TPA: hypothetical protein VJU87_10795 [Gemmatimonadaceae bacterium]|nr:hypothetical protein [Gemmatimonadaceae bacterium]
MGNYKTGHLSGSGDESVSIRGDWRPLYLELADDAGFQRLSGRAAKLWLLLKCTLPATGIGVVYPSKLCDQMGCGKAELEKAMIELQAPRPGYTRGWIEREQNIVWIIDGLREAALYSNNVKKHRPYVHRLVAPLPRQLTIVRRFKAEYEEWFPGEIDSLSDTVSDTQAIQKTPTVDKTVNDTAKAEIPTAPSLALVKIRDSAVAPRSPRCLRAAEVIAAIKAEFEDEAQKTIRRRSTTEAREKAAEFVFAYWATKLDHPNTLLDDKRLALLMRRLKENGDNASELFYVIDGALRDDWTMGRAPRSERKYDGIETIFRSRAKVEELAGLCGPYRDRTPHPRAAKIAAILRAAAVPTTNAVADAARG